jgi:tetratricopeptide (TPR) repeat protein
MTACPLTAENKKDVFTSANELYEKGRYTEAIDQYRAVIEKGNIFPEAYYNLANSYFKNQEIGYAVLYYEKALRLNPRNNDTKHNLNYIRSLIKDTPQNFWEQITEHVINLGSLNEITVLFLATYLLLVSGICLYLITKLRSLVYANTVFFLIFLSLACIFILKYNHEISTKWAVTIKGPVEARNGPGTDNSVGFAIPEGKKVIILGKKDEWTAVGIKPEGLKGWIENEYIKEISVP